MRLPIVPITAGSLAFCYAGVLALAAIDWASLSAFWPFSFVGIVGALIANSTGVGGGAVFVPAFSLLRETGTWPITPEQVVGVSFAIQCFGMTMGSAAWTARLTRGARTDADLAACETLKTLVPFVLAFCLPAMLMTQYFLRVDADFAFLLFKAFSVMLGLALLTQVLAPRRAATRPAPERWQNDRWSLVPVAIVGGMATALFSVGIGEVLALYLFLRRYPVDVCVAAAVVCSAASVWTGLVFHLKAGTIVWNILVFAAPAVMLGGFLARRLAHWLGAYRLKLMTAIWIVGSSLVLIALR